MIFKVTSLCFLYLLLSFVGISPTNETNAMTLEEAMDIAVKKHTQAQISQASIEEAEGKLIENKSYAYNPEISIEPQRRYFRDGDRYDDFYIGITQGIETAGKRRFRENAAEERLKAEKHRLHGAELQLKINAGYAYVEVVTARKRLKVREKQFNAASKLSKAVDRQLEVGEITSLQANLVKSSLSTALSMRSSEGNSLLRAENDLRIALSFKSDIEISDNVMLPPLNLQWSPQVDIDKNLKNLPDYRIAETIEKAFAEEANLAYANRIPDITVSFMTADEAGDRLYKLGVTIPIPLFNNHTGSYRAALAKNKKAELEKELLKSTLTSNADTAIKKHSIAMKALKTYREGRLEGAIKNADLAQKAYEAGELGLVEAIVHINQSLEAELTGIEILHQAWLARIDLAAALGRPEYILY